MARDLNKRGYSRRDALTLGAAVLASPLLIRHLDSPSYASSPTLLAPSATKIGESKPISNGQYNPSKDNIRLNPRSHRHDAVITHNGWQYVADYIQVGDPSVGPDIRRVTVARRQLPSGPWEQLWLADYDQITDDNHNTISIGVSPGDGRLHLAFDHHNNDLKYRKSVAGLTTNPSAFTWDASLFGSVQNNLGGTLIDVVTYPYFVSVPNGRLLLTFRQGRLLQDGEQWPLYEYDGATGSWASLGVFLSGLDVGDGNRRPYPNGLTYGVDGSLHVTWTWRATFDANTNHDLMYAYSDDDGRTWKNNAGTTIATTGSDPIMQDTAGIKVWTIPQGNDLINQEGQTIDSSGRVHVVMRDSMDGGSPRLYHYWRALNGSWTRQDTGIVPPGPTEEPWGRAKTVTDPSDNAYILIGTLKIYAADRSAAYTNWQLINNLDDGQFDGEVLYDRYRLDEDGVLSVHYQDKDAKPIRILDYTFS